MSVSPSPKGPVAILLCAGYGTRMGELTAKQPKPLLEVGGRPMLGYLLEAIAGLPGIEAVEVVTNALFAPAFRQWAAAASRPQLPIRVHDDGTRSAQDRLGAVGDLDFVLRRIGIPPAGALVAAGDNIFLFDLGPFWQAFREGHKTRVLALEENDRAALRQTGVLELAGERVVALVEKPAEPASNWACPSIYAFDCRALAAAETYLAEGHGRDEIGRFLSWLVARQEVEASRTQGRRLHVGNPEELARANQILAPR